MPRTVYAVVGGATIALHTEVPGKLEVKFRRPQTDCRSIGPQESTDPEAASAPTDIPRTYSGFSVLVDAVNSTRNWLKRKKPVDEQPKTKVTRRRRPTYPEDETEDVRQERLVKAGIKVRDFVYPASSARMPMLQHAPVKLAERKSNLFPPPAQTGVDEPAGIGASFVRADRVPETQDSPADSSKETNISHSSPLRVIDIVATSDSQSDQDSLVPTTLMLDRSEDKAGAMSVSPLLPADMYTPTSPPSRQTNASIARPAPACIHLEFDVATYQYRLLLASKQTGIFRQRLPINGYILHRLRSLGFVSPEEAQEKWLEKDWEEYRKYDAVAQKFKRDYPEDVYKFGESGLKPIMENGYPWIPVIEERVCGAWPSDKVEVASLFNPPMGPDGQWGFRAPTWSERNNLVAKWKTSLVAHEDDVHGRPTFWFIEEADVPYGKDFTTPTEVIAPSTSTRRRVRFEDAPPPKKRKVAFESSAAFPIKPKPSIHHPRYSSMPLSEGKEHKNREASTSIEAADRRSTPEAPSINFSVSTNYNSSPSGGVTPPRPSTPKAPSKDTNTEGPTNTPSITKSLLSTSFLRSTTSSSPVPVSRGSQKRKFADEGIPGDSDSDSPEEHSTKKRRLSPECSPSPSGLDNIDDDDLQPRSNIWQPDTSPTLHKRGNKKEGSDLWTSKPNATKRLGEMVDPCPVASGSRSITPPLPTPIEAVKPLPVRFQPLTRHRTRRFPLY